MLAAACTSTDSPAPAKLPLPSSVYVPGNQKLFQKGVNAFEARNYTRAFKIFSDLADHGDIAALRNVAFMQRKGLGTRKDIKAALDNYTTAADAGLPTAEADLGQMLLDGEAGPPDPDAALPLLRKAAKANHPVAQYLLGTLYETGRGVPRNLHRAEALYAAAAAHGDKQALARLSALKSRPQPPSGQPATGSASPPGVMSSGP